ncbi:hypothetical protein BDA99DRAFT_606520 [Phascolomyces articulosus]|uniref:Uncharacterized protein n=1 Tax=Phascolomyces articulosus TaxID=60185 RepID=A0AAD5PCD3_9FUNG|nr:hypothetical protein BDA99DRAFT_606520 [Phascolomyces articulosus]
MSTSALPTHNEESYTANEFSIIKPVYQYLKDNNFKHPYKDRYKQRELLAKITGCGLNIAKECIHEYINGTYFERGQDPDKKTRRRKNRSDKMTGLNEQQRQDYLRIRGMGPCRAAERATNRNTAPIAVNIQELATETTWNTITASNLSVREQQYHLKKAASNTSGQCFPRDILEQDQLDNDQHTLQQLRINSFDAVTILNQHNLNFDGADVGALARIYATFDAREEWLITQAVDKWIVSTGHGVATLPNDHTSDGWLFDTGAIKISIRRHFFTNEQDRRAPLVQTTCGAAGDHCRFASIIHPTRSGRRNVLPLRFNNQHQHNAEMALRMRHLLQEQHPAGQRQQIIQEEIVRLDLQ